ncbi:hypothetical protein JYU34_004414 [Plutella xylostella]|uniref:FLYWCH-type domain-containing protein n=1 Tax=Plutella xylostella TaxID=51655 RepID=A0ABQ7QXZ0_PLUXY|nr:hypothetical protein JYU34_004414 [Plutella xylostella]
MHKETKNKKRWSCSTHSNRKCHALVHTVGDAVVKVVNVHNHEPPPPIPVPGVCEDPIAVKKLNI